MDDLYFRYMTQGSYNPEDWGHAPRTPKKKVKPPKKSLTRKKIERVSAKINKLNDELKELRKQYLEEIKAGIA
jgi:hypothetical protein